MNRKQLLIALGIATVLLTVIGGLLERPMVHASGHGILSLEFAASKARVSQLLAQWGPKGHRAARISLIVDYAYMVSYGGFFTLAGLATRDLALRQGWRRLGRAGRVVPFFAFGAACFDAIENVLLLLAIAGHGGDAAPLIATICSSIKFTLITIAILYALCGLIGLIYHRSRNGRGAHPQGSLSDGS